MARFVPAFDINAFPVEARGTIQPGQWVWSGDPSNKGRFYAATGFQDVVAWLGNARGHRRSTGGIPGYFRTVHRYGAALKRNEFRRQKI